MVSGWPKAAALLLSLLTLLAAAGCAGRPPRPAPAGEFEVSPQARVPDLLVLKERGRLTLPELAEGLSRLANEGEGTVAQRLTALYEQWKIRPMPNTLLVKEADLDGDGVNEVVTALNDASSSVGTGALFIFHQGKDGSWQVDRSHEDVLGAGLNAVADITGDGRPDVIWSSTSAGANTTMTEIFVATWTPGQITAVPGRIGTTFGHVTVEGHDLLVEGGLMGGWGAGRAQRARTDRYTLKDGALTLVDQRFAPSPLGYHRLLDGMLAEENQRREDAMAAYREAAESDRETLNIEDTVPPAMKPAFDDAVRAMARFRLALLTGGRSAAPPGAGGAFAGLLHSIEGTSDAGAACQAAQRWAEATPSFVAALNSPRGWANPTWKPENICGRLPIDH